MKESELKKFESVKDDNLEKIVGGRRHHHSRAYHDGWVTGKVASIVGTVASIGVGIAGLCFAAKSNKK
ncbi:hypothetical protein [Lactobacillus sp. LL6]|uniref:hypothetical protein n=1 Tax=Lactobacillus sp. LL6 TaxID=2596827 RepID=UPI0011868059|nr:hypothetical protein [Lactobacillus sp. LL6]TSO25768.1 hypothetical protein FOD82_01435 [Lactobacillus sp. LL6]